VDEAAREAFRKEATRDFAANLKREREAAGLTQEGLAFKAGINRTHVGYLERQQRRPVLTTIRLLAKALEISSGRLVDPPDREQGTPIEKGAASGEKST
jgi:transcriptional regulator with XRE-family HTH domain